jgi:acetate kinase
MLAAALGGLDAFVFTAGVGENSAEIRKRIAERLAWLGATLDESANADRKLLISTSKSRVALYVIPTDEESMIAKHTLALIPRPHRRERASQLTQINHRTAGNV